MIDQLIWNTSLNNRKTWANKSMNQSPDQWWDLHRQAAGSRLVYAFMEDMSLWTHLGLLQTIRVNRRCGTLRWEAHSIDNLRSGSTLANYWITTQTHQADSYRLSRDTLLTSSTTSQNTCKIQQASNENLTHLHLLVQNSRSDFTTKNTHWGKRDLIY